MIGLLEYASVWMLSKTLFAGQDIMGGSLGVLGISFQWFLDLFLPADVAAVVVRVAYTALLPFPIWFGIAFYEYRREKKK